jgi:hypothetical protein
MASFEALLLSDVLWDFAKKSPIEPLLIAS